jgi:hypothetical protein
MTQSPDQWLSTNVVWSAPKICATDVDALKTLAPQALADLADAFDDFGGLDLLSDLRLSIRVHAGDGPEAQMNTDVSDGAPVAALELLAPSHHLSREPARDRGVSPRATAQAVSRRHSRACRAVDVGRCQRDARLAHLRGFRPGADSDGARPLYVDDPLAVDLANTVYALDAMIIDLCLSVFPWAHYRRHDAAVKLHTQVDLRGLIPTVVEITEGKRADVTCLDDLLIEAGAIYIMDRGYLDFERLHRFTKEAAFFVTRTKKGIQFRRRASHPVDFATGLVSDHTVALATAKARHDYSPPNCGACAMWIPRRRSA